MKLVVFLDGESMVDHFIVEKEIFSNIRNTKHFTQ